MQHNYFKYCFADHKMISSDDGLHQFYTKFQYSLFSVDLTKRQQEVRYKRIEDRDCKDRGYKRHCNEYAAACLLMDDLRQGQRFVDAAVANDSTNIHTWCNKGRLELKMKNVEEAKVAAFKILESMVTAPLVYRLKAKVDYGYWKAEALQSEEGRDECCEILKECLDEAGDLSEMQEYVGYTLLKILVRQLRSPDKYDKPRGWFVEKLSLVVDQLIVLYKSTNVEYQADAWIWLAELQFAKKSEEIPAETLNKFRYETHQDDIDIGSCLNKAIALDAKSSVCERKRGLRIGKNCLSCAYRCDNEDVSLYWFEKAVKISEKWMKKNYWVLMGSSTAAQGLFNIWAIHLYRRKEEFVNHSYADFYERTIGICSIILTNSNQVTLVLFVLGDFVPLYRQRILIILNTNFGKMSEKYCS